MDNKEEQAFANQFRPGLTKREYFAGLAMQGLINKLEAGETKESMSKFGDVAVFFADNLIEALDK